jgi:hypothetical protein
MQQQCFHPLDALPGAADMPTLTPVLSAGTGKTIICAEDNCAAAEKIHVLRRWGRNRRDARSTICLQDGPADGTVSHVKSQFQVSVSISVRHSQVLLALGLSLAIIGHGIKTKLDNADRVAENSLADR